MKRNPKIILLYFVSGRVCVCVCVWGVMLEEVGGLEKLNILNVMVDYRFYQKRILSFLKQILSILIKHDTFADFSKFYQLNSELGDYRKSSITQDRYNFRCWCFLKD